MASKKIEAMDVDELTPQAPQTVDIAKLLLSELTATPLIYKAMEHLLGLRASFSKAKYEDVVQYFQLSDTPLDAWPEIELPNVLLPDAFYKSYAECTLVGYANPGTLDELANEPTTALFLTSSFQRLVALFGGILRDRPERALPGTDATKGGKVEGEVYCVKDLLVYLRELKVKGKLQGTVRDKDYLNCVAQTMCELHAAYHYNRVVHQDLAPADHVPVYACLYDAVTAVFFSYDGAVFRKREFKDVPCPGPESSKEDLSAYVRKSFEIHCYTFAVLLEGYVNWVELYYRRSARRAEAGDVNPRGSHEAQRVVPPPPASSIGSGRPSTMGWNAALRKAHLAREYLRRAHATSSHKHAEDGLSCLFQSLELWPPVVSRSMGLLLPQTVDEWVADLALAYSGESRQDSDPHWTPTISVFSYPPTSEIRADAVERFWEMIPTLRFIFEPATKNGDQDPYETLSLMAKDPKMFRTGLGTVCPRASDVLIEIFFQTLAKSLTEGFWS
ncbi:hypothetical protein C8R47DRAFT_1221726 [Mycena vitilis]|nr:hypothetical protein C8R47DRAFT_1221726 [Mycena vitilis]